jgi:triacylglycerol esterase/lipase EstA (alpha/beta hydrolase family)
MAKNNYKIVLVHGYCGWAPEETFNMGNYWEYADRPEIKGYSSVYQARIGIVHSIHD